MRSHRSPLPDFVRLLDIRREAIADALDLHDTGEVDAALGELDYFLSLAWTFLRDVDRNASIPKQRLELKTLLRRPRIDAASVHGIDPATANRIGSHLGGGTLRLLYRNPSSEEILRAIRRALRQFPHRKRGRPANTGSLAFRQFALGLATIWRDHRGVAPTRSYNVSTRREFGPFRDFVDLIAGLIPTRIRASTKRDVARSRSFGQNRRRRIPRGCSSQRPRSLAWPHRPIVLAQLAARRRHKTEAHTNLTY